jgi:hypothetical protein
LRGLSEIQWVVLEDSNGCDGPDGRHDPVRDDEMGIAILSLVERGLVGLEPCPIGPGQHTVLTAGGRLLLNLGRSVVVMEGLP